MLSFHCWPWKQSAIYSYTPENKYLRRKGSYILGLNYRAVFLKCFTWHVGFKKTCFYAHIKNFKTVSGQWGYEVGFIYSYKCKSCTKRIQLAGVFEEESHQKWDNWLMGYHHPPHPEAIQTLDSPHWIRTQQVHGTVTQIVFCTVTNSNPGAVLCLLCIEVYDVFQQQNGNWRVKVLIMFLIYLVFTLTHKCHFH